MSNTTTNTDRSFKPPVRNVTFCELSTNGGNALGNSSTNGVINTNNRNGKMNVESAPYVYTSHITEEQVSVIFDIRFCPFLENVDLFATASAKQITIYESERNGTKIIPKAVFQDSKGTDEFYAVTWVTSSLDANQELLISFGGKSGGIRTVDPFKMITVRRHLGHGDDINDIATNPSQPYLFASASKDMTVRLWHVKQCVALAILGGYAGQKDQVISVDFHLSGDFIVSGSMDHTVRVWDIGHNKYIQKTIETVKNDEFSGQPVEMHYSTAQSRDLHTNYVDCVKFVGNYIFSKAAQSTLILSKFGDFGDILPCGTGDQFHQETLSQIMIQANLPYTDSWYIKFSIVTGPPQYSWIACGNERGEVHLWDLYKKPLSENCDFVLSDKELSPAVRVVNFNRSGSVFLAAGDDGRIVRYDRRKINLTSK